MVNQEIEQVVIRNCEALVQGNIAQLFLDLTPAAMAQLAQSPAATMSGPMPKVSAYQIIERRPDGADYRYTVHFDGDVRFGVRAHWSMVDGTWKIAGFEPFPLTDPAAPPGPNDETAPPTG